MNQAGGVYTRGHESRRTGLDARVVLEGGVGMRAWAGDCDDWGGEGAGLGWRRDGEGVGRGFGAWMLR